MDSPKFLLRDPSLEPLLDEFPREKFWEIFDLYQWEGFWNTSLYLRASMDCQKHFEARDDDVILASGLKTGSTWMKALCRSIFQQKRHSTDEKDDEKEDKDEDKDFLAKTHTAYSVSSLEGHAYIGNPHPDFSTIPSPRLFHTHISYNLLPPSIRDSKCKIVYIARNPKDTLVSLWHFINCYTSTEKGPYPFDKAFESFYNGVHPWGPFWDHNLQYWQAGLEQPHKILFLKYEDLKRDPRGQVKKLAEFLGRPFKFGDEDAVDKVVWRCSLDRLKNLDVNKGNARSILPGIPKDSFFRLGVVGDWKNHFTEDMADRLDQLTRIKLQGSGLHLD